jgi:hypothetical protein
VMSASGGGDRSILDLLPSSPRGTKLWYEIGTTTSLNEVDGSGQDGQIGLRCPD